MCGFYSRWEWLQGKPVSLHSVGAWHLWQVQWAAATMEGFHIALFSSLNFLLSPETAAILQVQHSIVRELFLWLYIFSAIRMNVLLLSFLELFLLSFSSFPFKRRKENTSRAVWESTSVEARVWGEGCWYEVSKDKAMIREMCAACLSSLCWVFGTHEKLRRTLYLKLYVPNTQCLWGIRHSRESFGTKLDWFFSHANLRRWFYLSLCIC